MANNSQSSETLLAPLRVLELGSRAGVGALGGLLAQLGADVVAIEPPQAVDLGKWRNRVAAMTGKRSIVVDKSTKEGFRELEALAADADILLLSSDVDGEQFAYWERPPHQSAIVCDITAFGHSGPAAGKAVPEWMVQAVSGVLDTTGPEDDKPCAIGTPILEMHAAVLAATATLAALRVRRREGFGQKIDLALFDVGVTALMNFVPLYLTGRDASRCGNRHPLYGAWGSYKAQDGWILICAPSNENWKRLCSAMQRPELAEDPRYVTAAIRLDHFREIDDIISAWTGHLSLGECERRLRQHGVACGPVVEFEDAAKEPNLSHRSAVQEALDRASGRIVKVPTLPLRSDLAKSVAASFIPRPDEDRRSILESIRKGITPASPSASPGEVSQPYHDIRVVEIGQHTVAPLASRIMGAMGAEVVKVEQPSGDVVRHSAPLRDDGKSFVFAMTNTDKRGIVLDLKSERDRETLHALLSQSDILVENLKPGSLAKLGFGPERLRASHPHLIYCSVNGFGMDSVYPGRPALDTVVQAMSGLMSLTRSGTSPMKTGISCSDNFGGQFALFALSVGVEYRDRTGVALHFDLSMQDASSWATHLEWNNCPRSVLPALVTAADGFVAVNAPQDAVESRLAAHGINSRSCARDRIVELLAGELEAAPVLTVGEALTHAQTVGRNLLVERSSHDGDSWQVFSTPFKLMGTPAEVSFVISSLGVDDDAVRADFGLPALEKQRV